MTKQHTLKMTKYKAAKKHSFDSHPIHFSFVTPARDSSPALG